MRIGFTGHEKDRNGEAASTTEDAQTESYNFGARSYLPDLGRFSTPDPARDPSSWSLYGYAGGNRMMFVDPDGLAPEGWEEAIRGFIFGVSDGAGGPKNKGWRERRKNDLGLPTKTADMARLVGEKVGGAAPDSIPYVAPVVEVSTTIDCGLLVGVCQNTYVKGGVALVNWNDPYLFAGAGRTGLSAMPISFDMTFGITIGYHTFGDYSGTFYEGSVAGAPISATAARGKLYVEPVVSAYSIGVTTDSSVSGGVSEYFPLIDVLRTILGL